MGLEALEHDDAPWVQVVVSQWFALVGGYVDPQNAIMVTRGDAATPGVSRVVLQTRVSVAADPGRG